MMRTLVVAGALPLGVYLIAKGGDTFTLVVGACLIGAAVPFMVNQ